MRTAANNPFTPGSDTVPLVWAGRVTQLQDWEAVVRPRRLRGIPERGRTIVAEAGLGKSSLVRRIAESARSQGDWVTGQVRIPLGADSLKAVAAEVLKLADYAGLSSRRERRLRDLLDRVRSVAVRGMSLTFDRAAGPEPYTSLTELLIEIGLAARSQDRMVLIHVDEVQNVTDEKELSHLLVALGDAIVYEHEHAMPDGARFADSLPIAVYLTGLPEFLDMAGSNQGSTFARRFKPITLESIGSDDFEAALHEFVASGWEVADGLGGTSTIRMTKSAAKRIVDLCQGEPFLFQLAGEQAWYSGDEDLITESDVLRGWKEATPEAVLHVGRILNRLPERERQLIEHMAQLPAKMRTATKIAQSMGFADASAIGASAQRLDTARRIISRGKPYEFRHQAVEAYLTSEWPYLS